MARNLLRAGHGLLAYDIKPERLAACVEAGAEGATYAAEVVERCEIVLTSLRSSAVFVDVAEEHFIPNARPGQVFLDLGTVAPPETRRIGGLLAEKGAALVDAPVSGGPGGSESGTLYIFVGGDDASVAGCMPILHVLGDPEHVTHCGPTGSGQVVKGVNQLVMGLVAAAHVEAMAFGVRGGVAPEAVRDAVGGPGGWRGVFAGLAQHVMDHDGDGIYVKFPEFPYFLAEAAASDFPMPLTQALYDFMRAGDVSCKDNMQRDTACLWRELMTRGREE
jgi:3-hydroxyisobutyrate dehydrogenase-like beta-hydroxyacid dehydrogenase